MSGVNKLKQTVKLHVMGIFFFLVVYGLEIGIFPLMMGLRISSPLFTFGSGINRESCYHEGRLKPELYLWARNGR